jgi:hypothetical protein
MVAQGLTNMTTVLLIPTWPCRGTFKRDPFLFFFFFVLLPIWVSFVFLSPLETPFFLSVANEHASEVKKKKTVNSHDNAEQSSVVCLPVPDNDASFLAYATLPLSDGNSHRAYKQHSLTFMHACTPIFSFPYFDFVHTENRSNVTD